MISKAKFNEPYDLKLLDNKLFVADKGNHVIRVIELNNIDEVADT